MRVLTWKTLSQARYILMGSLITLISACAQSEFAGDTGQGVRSGVKPPPGGPDDPGTPGGGPTTPGSGDGLKTDGGDKIELVETELAITRSQDQAKYTNCVFAHLIDQPPVALSCNKDAQGNRINLTELNVKLKLKTNTCNQLRVFFTSTGRPDPKTISTANPGQVSFNAIKHSTTNGPGLNIKSEATGSFAIEANDNNDKMWHDVYLRVNPPANEKNIKFTIENSGIPCQ